MLAAEEVQLPRSRARTAGRAHAGRVREAPGPTGGPRQRREGGRGEGHSSSEAAEAKAAEVEERDHARQREAELNRREAHLGGSRARSRPGRRRALRRQLEERERDSSNERSHFVNSRTPPFAGQATRPPENASPRARPPSVHASRAGRARGRVELRDAGAEAEVELRLDKLERREKNLQALEKRSPRRSRARKLRGQAQSSLQSRRPTGGKGARPDEVGADR